MRQPTRSPLVQIIVHRLLGGNPLSEIVMAIWELDSFGNNVKWDLDTINECLNTVCNMVAVFPSQYVIVRQVKINSSWDEFNEWMMNNSSLVISYESGKIYWPNHKTYMFWFQFPQTLTSAFLDLLRLPSHDLNPGSITKTKHPHLAQHMYRNTMNKAALLNTIAYPLAT